MASSGKKGKKKGTAISLQSFLAIGDIPVGTTQVTKKVRNLDGEESDDGGSAMPVVLQLPTAPRANRMFDDDSVPHNPPFIAYLTNLPFDAKEDDIYEFFGAMPIASLRLPREEGESGRVRGFGYVEFNSRDDLIETLSLPDPSIKGRRIRIELSNESDQGNFRNRGNRRGYEGMNNREDSNRDSTNWRRDNIVNDNYDRGFSREKKYEGDNNYDRGFRREKRYDGDDKKESGGGSWRSFGNSNNNNDFVRSKPSTFERDDQEMERPKLNLKPRTLPLPAVVVKEEESDEEKKQPEEDEKPKSKSPERPSQNVFGSAKPVDTAARESEIEERMSEARRQRQAQNEATKAELPSEKVVKDNTNNTTSWRRKDEVSQQKNDRWAVGQGREKLETLKIDNRRYGRDDSRQTKARDQGERVDKNSQNVRDENKVKQHHTKNVNAHQENSGKAVLQSSNKYSGLDDEASE